MPHPSDVELIAGLTGTSMCWIMFGLGPIRSGGRDLQAVRHQNLVYFFRAVSDKGAKSKAGFVNAVRLDTKKIAEHVDNPFQHIGERLAQN